jgi:hypothetical protein
MLLSRMALSRMALSHLRHESLVCVGPEDGCNLPVALLPSIRVSCSCIWCIAKLWD